MAGLCVVVHLPQFEKPCSTWIVKQLLLLPVGIVFRMSVIKVSLETMEIIIHTKCGQYDSINGIFSALFNLITVKNTIKLLTQWMYWCSSSWGVL
jgi:hypothetical protein